jgi:hypothetical protein
MTGQQPYEVAERRDGFELRRYPAHLVAEIEVGGSFDEAPDRALGPLAGHRRRLYTCTGALGTGPIFVGRHHLVRTGRGGWAVAAPAGHALQSRSPITADRAYVRKTLAKMSQASSDLAVRLKAM